MRISNATERSCGRSASNPSERLNQRAALLGVTVPVFKMSESHATVTAPPQPVGAQTEVILADLGYSAAEIEALGKEGAINAR